MFPQNVGLVVIFVGFLTLPSRTEASSPTKGTPTSAKRKREAKKGAARSRRDNDSDDGEPEIPKSGRSSGRVSRVDSYDESGDDPWSAASADLTNSKTSRRGGESPRTPKSPSAKRAKKGPTRSTSKQNLQKESDLAAIPEATQPPSIPLTSPNSAITSVPASAVSTPISSNTIAPKIVVAGLSSVLENATTPAPTPIAGDVDMRRR